MTVGEAKTILYRARDTAKAYRLTKDKVNAYKQLLASGKTIRYESDGSVHERYGNSVERAYCRLADYESELEEALAAMVKSREVAEELIQSVEDAVQREVLTRRYLIGQRWEDIAYSMNYSRQHVTRLHGYALQKMCLNVTFSS